MARPVIVQLTNGASPSHGPGRGTSVQWSHGVEEVKRSVLKKAKAARICGAEYWGRGCIIKREIQKAVQRSSQIIGRILRCICVS